MKLKNAKIYKYKTFENEQNIFFEKDYTAIVGMNESFDVANALSSSLSL